MSGMCHLISVSGKGELLVAVEVADISDSADKSDTEIQLHSGL